MKIKLIPNPSATFYEVTSHYNAIGFVIPMPSMYLRTVSLFRLSEAINKYLSEKGKIKSIF